MNNYEAPLRNLDPQTGRWWQVDPEIGNGQESVSPYSANFDDPIKYFDPRGNLPDATGCCGGAGTILWNTQKLAGETVLAGGGPEDPVADIVAGAIELGGDIWAGVEALKSLHPHLPSKTQDNSATKTTPAPTPATTVTINKKGPKDLVQDAKDQKAKEEKAQTRQDNKTQAKARAEARTGNSNQTVRGEHNSGGRNSGKHEKANARRAKEQSAADAAKQATQKPADASTAIKPKE